MVEVDVVSARKWYRSERSFFAPRKFVPLSVWISVGSPLREMKRLSEARNASVVSTDTISKCTAFVARQTNRARYAFTNKGFLVCPLMDRHSQFR